MRRARGDQHAFAGQRPRFGRAQETFGGSNDFKWLRHPSDSGFAGFRHLAGIGSDHGDAVALKLRHIAAGRRIAPHHGVHGRRQQDRPAGREQNGAGEVIGGALRHLRHQVRGRGRDHDQVAVTRQANMAGIELALRVEQVGVNASAREGARRERRDELLGGLGQHATDADMPLLQPPNQIQRLIGRDTPADDQGHVSPPGGVVTA